MSQRRRSDVAQTVTVTAYIAKDAKFFVRVPVSFRSTREQNGAFENNPPSHPACSQRTVWQRPRQNEEWCRDFWLHRVEVAK